MNYIFLNQIKINYAKNLDYLYDKKKNLYLFYNTEDSLGGYGSICIIFSLEKNGNLSIKSRTQVHFVKDQENEYSIYMNS